MNDRRWLLAAAAAFAACIALAARAQAQPAKPVTGPILLVTSSDMNGQTSDPKINAFLESQVRQFAAATKDLLVQQGHEVELADLSNANAPDPQAALLQRLKASPKRYAYLGQIYWGADAKESVNILAVLAPLSYGAESVKFGGGNEPRFQEKAYFLFGPGATSKRSIEQDARTFVESLQLLGKR